VQPLSLLLNGITALFSTFGFARSGHVIWKQAIALAVITTLAAPIGAYLAQDIAQQYIWYIYFVAVLFLAYRLLGPSEAGEGEAEERAQATSRPL
jgi:uncharacterized membrane protein YfcA